MAVLEVIKMGNPLLRETSEIVDVKKIASKDFQQFIDDLIDTMQAKNGAGIAAPQVGALIRLFAMEMKDNPRYPEKETFPLSIVINPEIEFLSEEKTASWEGCLSIPGIRGMLKRYKHIKINGLDRNGHRFETELNGFAAIVAQHELDHLNGILLIDRMDSMETLTFEEEFEKYWCV